MPSKGVDTYSFVTATNPPGPLCVIFSVQWEQSAISIPDVIIPVNLQVDSSELGPGVFTGPFTFAAESIDPKNVFATKTNQINTLTGDLEAGSTMSQMLACSPVVDPNSGTITSYGFYDSGDGSSGLTDQDQCYVYSTRNLSSWMTDMVAANPGIASKPFCNFVLSGAHDAGMCTMLMIDQILSSQQGRLLELAIAALEPAVGAAIATGLVSPATIIMNAAITQKDTPTQMLSQGCRYFDFRPGYMHPDITGFPGRYHQHNMTPGMPYLEFLVEVQKFLSQNPGEIVVISCNTQGFADPSMRPEPIDLVLDWNSALSYSKVTIGYSDSSALNESYSSLIASNKRVIFLNQIDNETTKYDSYNAAAYGTLKVDPIINALNGMNTGGQEDCTYTVLQLQGTASAACSKDGFLSESLTASPLMSTKGRFDSSTLAWVAHNAPNNLKANKLVVLLNDFIEVATSTTAINWTLQRMSQ